MMGDDKLDAMERDAYQAIRYLQEQYNFACKPYIEILNRIHSIRPHIFYVDGKTMIPILPPKVDKIAEDQVKSDPQTA